MPWIDDWFAKVHYPLTTERSMLIKKSHEHTRLPEPLPYFHISGVKWKGGSQDRIPFKVFLIAESNTFSTNETVSLSGITMCHNVPALVQVVGSTFSSLNPVPYCLFLFSFALKALMLSFKCKNIPQLDHEILCTTIWNL